MQKILWNQGWRFTKQSLWPDGSNLAPMTQDWQGVCLPHTWNALDGQDGGQDYYRGTCWYVKSLAKADTGDAAAVYLEFEGANASADVYVNGKKAAHHDGGYSTWRVDLTDLLQDENEIAVAVDNSPSDTVYPQSADFTFYGGLYRDVNLLLAPATRFSLDFYGSCGVFVTPVVSGRDAVVSVSAQTTNVQHGDTLRYTVLDAEGRPAAQAQTNAKGRLTVMTLPEAHLWNGRRDPYLYTLQAELCRGETVLDTRTVKFGCRSYEIDPEEGFILNGKSYPLHGVSRHQDFLGIGNALLPEHHRRDVELICEMGATTVRLAHYQHNQVFYDLCDASGLVVWAEIPYISVHMEKGRANTISQMQELVLQNYNHPSIVVWGLSNEITCGACDENDLLENHRILNDMVHALDPTRLTTVAVVSECPIDHPYLHISDVVSYNHYFGWYGGKPEMNGSWMDDFHQKYPDLPIGMSEYGCEALDWHTSHPAQGDYTEEYQAYYHECLIKQLFTRPYIWATHVWNMFDFGADNRDEGGEAGQNHKGLVTMDRQYKKDAFYAYKAWLSDEPFVHIAGKRYVDRVEDVTAVRVYSNQPEVELFANGVSLGRQTAEDHFFTFQVPNAGQTRLKACAGPCTDESLLRKVDTPNESYIMPMATGGEIINWFEITEKPGRYSINDKMGVAMKNPECYRLVEEMLRVAFAAWNMEVKPGEFLPDGGATGRMYADSSVLSLLLRYSPSDDENRFTKAKILALNAKLNEIPRL